jgi:hypothetical protein
MNTTPDHPDFTALALGEHILGSPSPAVTDALRSSVSARQEMEQIRITAKQLSLVLKGQRVTRLDAARRNAVLHADPAVVRARFAAEAAVAQTDTVLLLQRPVAPVKRRKSWFIPAAAAALLAACSVAAIKWLPSSRSSAEEQSLANKATPARSADKVEITVAAPEGSARPRPVVPPAPLHTVKNHAPSAPVLRQLNFPAPAPFAPDAVAHQPPVEPENEAAPAQPPAFAEPLGDFATPEKRRDRRSR